MSFFKQGLVIITMLHLCFFRNTVFAASSATIGTSTTTSVVQNITPTESGQLGTNQAATVQYSTTCKNTSGSATIYISSTSPALTGSGTANGSTIPASSNTSANTLSKDTWGYSLNSSSTNTSSYLGVTTSNTEIATLTPNSSGTASGSKTIYYNANVSTAKPSGTYSTTVTYTAVMSRNCEEYTVNYDTNSIFGISTTSGTVASSTFFRDNTQSFSSGSSLSKTGYTFQGWAKTKADADNGTVHYCVSKTDKCNGAQTYADSAVNPSNVSTITVYAVWTLNTYTITLDNSTNGATNNPTDSTIATYGSSSIRIATAPVKSYTFSTSRKNESAVNASIGGNSTTYTYTFDGWWTTASGNGSRVISADKTLVANVSGYTDSSGQWVGTSDITLYARWTAGTDKTLPYIAQSDSTYGDADCYWANSDDANAPLAYASRATISSPTSGATLYGVCTFSVRIFYFDSSGVTQVAVRANGTSASNTLMGTVTSSGGMVSGLRYGVKYYLIPSYSSDYEISGWDKNSIRGTLSSTTTVNPYVTIGSGQGLDDGNVGGIGVTVTGKRKNCTVGTITGVTTQAFNASNYSNYCIGSTGTLTDSRDGNTYTVAKLADGKWWMTQNLRLIGRTIYSSDSNFTSKSSYTVPSSFWYDWSYTSAYVYQPNSITDDSTLTPQKYTGNDTISSWSNTTDINDVGVMYNFCAAVAATICSSSVKTEATEDICPKGWHLPSTNSVTSDFGTLVVAYGGNPGYLFNDSTIAYKKFNNAFRPVLTGWYSSSKFNNSGSSGYYWTTVSSSSGATRYSMHVTLSDIYSASNGLNNRDGISVRCVAK